MIPISQHIFSLFFIVFLLFPIVLASDGDRSPFYQNCVKSCMKSNCTADREFTEKAAQEQDVWCWLLQWGCQDDCRYRCMWKTVDGFEERGYPIPKFHGKWPFKRILGVQEPGSAFASLLNLASHVYMHSELRATFSIRDTPLVLFWHAFAFAAGRMSGHGLYNFIVQCHLLVPLSILAYRSCSGGNEWWVCIHAWTWSAIFHTRDVAFTEFMDYACALSMVMALFVSAIVRVFHRKRKLTCCILVLPLLYYLEHVRYLYSGRIDYNYNMMANLIVGVSGGAVWAGWALGQVVGGRGYAGRVLVFTLASGAALGLELLDFAPALHAWDAHALWHLCTAPLPLLFYRFVIDDLTYLRKTSLSEKSDLKLT